MKKNILYLLLISMAAASCSDTGETASLQNQRDTISWAMGMSLAQTVNGGFYDFDKDIIIKAFKSSLAGEKQPLSQEAYNEACQYMAMLVAQQERNMAQQQANTATQRENQLFSQLTAQKPNIKKSPDGYYYEILKEGHGPNATVGKRIRFDFKGINMTNQQIIEQTYGRRDPVVHVLDRPMFPGLLSGIQLMNAGSKYRFYFPYRLVTGANGIPPYTPVIYEVELHEIYND